jgi:hypothetical protein
MASADDVIEIAQSNQMVEVTPKAFVSNMRDHGTEYIQMPVRKFEHCVPSIRKPEIC